MEIKLNESDVLRLHGIRVKEEKNFKILLAFWKKSNC
jgi:hypothetical protein